MIFMIIEAGREIEGKRLTIAKESLKTNTNLKEDEIYLFI